MTSPLESHPQAGKTVKLTKGKFKGEEYRIEDWWHKITGNSWMYSEGNPACLNYAIRSSQEDLPLDDQVLYGKIGALGYLIHESEIL